MKRWITYYFVAIILVLGLNTGGYYVLAICSDGLLAVLVFYYAQYFVAIIIAIMQFIIIRANLGNKIRFKFMIAFAALYTIILAVIYAFSVQYEYQKKATYILLKDSGMEVGDEYYNIPFLGIHLVFIVPLVLQMYIYRVLYIKNKRLVLKTNEAN